MRPLSASLAAAALLAALAASASAQTAPPAPAATTVPWHPRPVIIIDPRQYLASPSPRPHSTHRPTPRPHAFRRPLHRAGAHPAATPDVFERHDTAPPPTTPP
ncbi:MAG TPA: hypothetical protein VHS78_02805 [Candidatus Elarobacter sp.]|nr:hypothetical protein [Candidatus Elarobacter sp.]